MSTPFVQAARAVVPLFALSLLSACGAEPKQNAVPAAAPVTTAAASGLAAASAEVPASEAPASAAPGGAPTAAPGSAPPVGVPPVVGGDAPGGGEAAWQVAAAPEAAPEKIEVAVGATFDVRVAGNVTTGFQWKVQEPLDPHLSLDSDAYETDPNPPGPGGAVKAGVGGTHRFTFKGVSAGVATVRLRYARSWEKGPPARVQTYEVTVK